MSHKIAYLNAQIRGSEIRSAYVHKTPNGEIIDSIDRLDKDKKLNRVEVCGTPNQWSATTEWTEVFYASGKKNRIVRGWIATKLLDIHADPLHPDTGETVHERQVKYEDSVKFPPRDTSPPIPDKLFRTNTERFFALMAFAGALFFIAEYIVGPLYEVLFP